ncbi:MAG: polysaccharide deacetylase family protein [Nanoarchaeota archaeon]
MKNQRIPILMYHEIIEKGLVNKFSDFIQKNYIVETTFFEKQLQYLSQQRFKCITISDLLELTTLSDKNIVCITFDDGYLGNYQNAFPLLMKYNYKATFFLVTDWIGKKNMMNWQQVNEMMNKGMEIGSHTKSHLMLSGYESDKVYQELWESREGIKKNLNFDCKIISYPGGSYTSKVNEIALRVGYKHILSSDFGYFESKINNVTIKRIVVGNSLSALLHILHPGRLFLLTCLTKETIKKFLKLLLGRVRYDQIYFKLFNLHSPVKEYHVFFLSLLLEKICR